MGGASGDDAQLVAGSRMFILEVQLQQILYLRS